MCRHEWHRVSSQLGLLTAVGLTFVVGAMPRVIGGVILLLWHGTCSLHLAGNSGHGGNLYGFWLKTLLCHVCKPNISGLIWTILSSKSMRASMSTRPSMKSSFSRLSVDTCSAASKTFTPWWSLLNWSLKFPSWPSSTPFTRLSTHCFVSLWWVQV